MRSPVETTEESLHYYVINLPKSAKRREHMREVLKPLFPPRSDFLPRSRAQNYLPRKNLPHASIWIFQTRSLVVH